MACESAVLRTGACTTEERRGGVSCRKKEALLCCAYWLICLNGCIEGELGG